MRTTAGSWCAAQNSVGEFLQAEFEEVKTITRMTVQGHHSDKEWVSRISLGYTIDGANWYNYSITSGSALSDPITVSNKVQYSTLFNLLYSTQHHTLPYSTLL